MTTADAVLPSERMKRQTLIMIVFAAILLPITWWSADSAAKLKEKQLELWRQKRAEFYKAIADHPEKIKDRPDREQIVAQLLEPRNAAWLRAHPQVGEAIAALRSSTAVLHADGTAAPSSETPARPTGPLPERRARFLEAVAAQGSHEITFTTKTITAHLAREGASVDSLFFNEFKEPSFKPLAERDPPLSELGPFVELKTFDPRLRSFALESNSANEALEKEPWLHEAIEGGHRFTRVLPDGDLVVTKEYLLAPATTEEYKDYHFILRVKVENRGEKVHTFNYALLASAGIVEPTTSSPLPVEAVIGRRDDQGGFSVEKRGALDTWKDVRDGKPPLRVQAGGGNRIGFYGLVEKQFACVVIPQDEKLPVEAAGADTLTHLLGMKPNPADEAAFKTQESRLEKEIAVKATRSQYSIAPGQAVAQDYFIYAGPLWKELLENHPVYQKANLGSLIDYPSWIPGVRFLAILLTKLLLGFHVLFHSWGVSIILLTILVRAALHPLMVKQTKSTQKMQSLAPEVNKLKEKYQDKDGQMSPEDQKKFQTEQMELWKKHGINPLGCMGPMFLQLPIFLGLWNALRYAFELRQSSFLWIRDLTEPDVIYRLPFTLPFHGTNALCILPIIMLIVYLLQMKTMPKSVDPQQAEQAKMMQWMMPIMGYMFYSLQSGLLLYYITSSVIGMLEQRWIKKRLGITQPAVGVPAKV